MRMSEVAALGGAARAERNWNERRTGQIERDRTGVLCDNFVCWLAFGGVEKQLKVDGTIERGRHEGNPSSGAEDASLCAGRQGKEEEEEEWSGRAH